MNKKNTSRLIALILSPLIAPHTETMASENPSDKTIIISSDLWCPYACEQDGKMPGYMIETAKAIFKKHGYEVQYKLTAWPRAIEDARINKTQAIVGASHADAPDFVFPAIPFLNA